MEDRKTVILQSHMDMVCEKNNDTEHDFDTDPIQTYVMVNGCVPKELRWGLITVSGWLQNWRSWLLMICSMVR